MFITDDYVNGMIFDNKLTKNDIKKISNYNQADLTKLIDTSIVNFTPIQQKMIKYYRRYTGKELPIFKRKYPPFLQTSDKINMVEIHNNFEGEIVDSKISYLFSNPIVRRIHEDENEKINVTLKEFNITNRVHDLDAEISKMATITGYGACMMYVSTQPNEIEKLVSLNPWETIFITDNFDNKKFVIRFWEETNLNDIIKYKIELYDTKNIIYIDAYSEQYRVTEIKEHGFDRIPIFQIKNNEELRSDIDPVVNLIDAYDIGLSDLSNELLGTRNAKMISKGAEIELEAIKDSNITGAINVPEGAEISYLYKELKNDAYIQYYEKLEDNIARFSGTPDFTNIERTGNLTNLGISFLYTKLDQRAGNFKRKFSTYLYEMYDCLATILAKRGVVLDVNKMEYIWSEKKPYNAKENADIQATLLGKISDVTRLSKDPSIDNPQQEKENWLNDLEEQTKREVAGFEDDGKL